MNQMMNALASLGIGVVLGFPICYGAYSLAFGNKTRQETAPVSALPTADHEGVSVEAHQPASSQQEVMPHSASGDPVEMAKHKSTIEAKLGVKLKADGQGILRHEATDQFTTIELKQTTDGNVDLVVSNDFGILWRRNEFHSAFVGEFPGQKIIGKFLISFPESDYNHMKYPWWKQQLPSLALVDKALRSLVPNAAGASETDRMYWWAEQVRDRYSEIMRVRGGMSPWNPVHEYENLKYAGTLEDLRFSLTFTLPGTSAGTEARASETAAPPAPVEQPAPPAEVTTSSRSPARSSDGLLHGVTKKGYLAAISRKALDKAISYVVDKDNAGLERMVAAHQIVLLQPGLDVVITDSEGIFAQVLKFRLPGSSSEFYTTTEAIDLD